MQRVSLKRVIMDIALIQSAMSSLNSAANIAKAILNLKVSTEVQGKVVELQSLILAAQSDALSANAAQTEMADQIQALKDEISCIQAWEKQVTRYQLFSPWTGTLVYALRESEKESEPAHWICTHCYSERQRGFLQFRRQASGRQLYACDRCGTEVNAHKDFEHPVQFEYIAS